jgi:hypothetical protein
MGNRIREQCVTKTIKKEGTSRTCIISNFFTKVTGVRAEIFFIKLEHFESSFKRVDKAKLPELSSSCGARTR